MKLRIILFNILLLCGVVGSFGQDKTSQFQFTNQKLIPHTPVKNQNITNTCWAFSAISLLESELLRMGKGQFDLSEMFIVKFAYQAKALKYMRMHGNSTFAGGGENNDVTDVIANYGIVPENAYPGLKPDEEMHNHTEMDKVLKSFVEGVSKDEGQKLSLVWDRGFQKLVEAYLGEVPEKFMFNDKKYTPKSFAAELGLNPNDYIMLGSYTHHPFYEKFILEVPDNWSWGQIYNIPLNEMIMVIDTALAKNYSVSWAADNSEKGFSFSRGLALVPDLDEKKVPTDVWNAAMSQPGNERIITQEMRQREFDNFSTTDDHGMHIVGWATDQTARKYYYVKNSWGTGNLFGGYQYASEAYVKLKTTVIMLNKNALPQSVRNRFADLK